ncbi:MaoC/PaaZ C-terminal domain-containing protein [Roseomonas sp. CCTCC AB2023176]|uniref:MaoC/PaaZ C-terminal domain-containing protein n=1 Tax=Roseomonas sp. CCTCC AB2023176 TaxID=3342640 RepID=UPI0035DEC255
MSRAILDGSELRVGDVIPVGSVSFTVEEITDFARRYDPQPFHLDEEAARTSIFGGLCASGFHTLAACFGAQVRAGVLTPCNLGGRGIAGLAWRRPTWPGVEYTLSLEVRSLVPNPARERIEAGIGYVLCDPEGAVVMDATPQHLLRATRGERSTSGGEAPVETAA